jgi:hypothetical protein
MPDLILNLATALTTSSRTTKPKLGIKVNQNLRGSMPGILRWQRGGVATPAGNLAFYGVNVPNPWANRANTFVFRQRTDVTDANLVVGDYQILTNLPYVAFSNYNWLVLLDEFDRQVTEIGATLGAVISSGIGTMTRVDFTPETDTGDGATVNFDLAIDFEALQHLACQVKVNSVTQAASAFSFSQLATGKARITFAVAPGNTLAINYQFYPKPGKSFGVAYVAPVLVKDAVLVPQGLEEIPTKDAMWLVTGAGVTGSINADVLPSSSY